jgi:hypothetical protein
VRAIAGGSREKFHLSLLFAAIHAGYLYLFMRSPAAPETRTATTRKPPPFHYLHSDSYRRRRRRRSVSSFPWVTCMTSETCSGTKGAMAAPHDPLARKESAQRSQNRLCIARQTRFASSGGPWIEGDECRRRRRGRWCGRVSDVEGLSDSFPSSCPLHCPLHSSRPIAPTCQAASAVIPTTPRGLSNLAQGEDEAFERPRYAAGVWLRGDHDDACAVMLATHPSPTAGNEPVRAVNQHGHGDTLPIVYTPVGM